MANDLTKLSPTMTAELKKRNLNGQTWKVLKETIFKDAADESILMAIDYCKVRNLDILKKPVHIVPIWDSNAKKMVDTIWQGISELRTTAMRTGQYAGCDETVYGPNITQKIGGVEITFPEYAQVTVYRMLYGEKVKFVGDKVYWKETVSTKKDGNPNSMWQQRPYGQIAKCAEAAALRKAFPEELGNEYAAEEMGNKAVQVSKVEKKEEIIDVFAEQKESLALTQKNSSIEVDPKLEELANQFYEEHKDELNS